MAQTKIRGNSQIQQETITNNEIANSAAIATSKLADGANFIKRDGSVAFTGDQSLGNKKITNLANGTNPNDAVNKSQLDAVSAGITWKESVRAATTANITLIQGPTTIDGVALHDGDRVLVKNQTNASENGIYIYSQGEYVRSPDADTSTELKSGTAVFVNEGTINADTGWVLTTENPITLGTTALTFTQFTGLAQITAGIGLSKTGNTLDVNIGDGLQNDGDFVSVKPFDDSIFVDTNGIGINSSYNYFKEAVRVATVNNITLSGTQTIDGIAVGVDDRVLVKAQTVESDNGIYLCKAGAWVRTLDATYPPKQLNRMTFVPVKEGTINGGKLFYQTNLLTGAGQAINFQVFSPEKEGTQITRETPSGTINGSNTVFTLAYVPVPGSEMVYLNGILQDAGAGNDYIESAGDIIFAVAPISGDKIRVSYRTLEI
jgi:hypothetical protein